MQEFRAKQGSAYLWKPHADALTWLVTTGQKVELQCAQVVQMAEKRGLQEKAAAVKASSQKVDTDIQEAAKMLQGNAG
jgi:hypothetical protein